MATAPPKSQPLHNFSLPSFLRWGGGSSNHHQRFRRSAPPGDSPVVEADSDRTDSDHDSRSPWVGSRHSHRFLFNAACSENLGKPHGHLKELKVENQGIGGRDEIMNTKNGEKGSGEADETEHMPLSREAVQRSWNLRPRRSNPSSKDAEYSSVFIAAAQSPGYNHVSKPLRLRGHADSSAAAGGEGKEKRRLRIALSKEEIEEDIFSMTGSRPARRPKKRPKHVQKVLNTIFPGLWLVGASAADYRMADAQTKVEMDSLKKEPGDISGTTS
ncbi:hypothetical protein SAY86_012388 [Trapa natans]|uniref:Uncharacterized protein n=1 Tax=Trapa natans TaxID=22666 RepID=A0AAN7LXW7_TRANT|nr:hypothetical protein SAY86_012388 [Trapa natans]